MFDTHAQAEKAATDLASAGIPRNDVSLVASNQNGQFGANPEGSTTSGSSDTGHAMAADAEAGGVRVYTHVEQRPVEQQVTLHEEHVNVERRPVNRPVSESEFTTMKDQSFEVRKTAEQPVAAKQARIVEEVVINKEASDRVETVRDTVRSTDVEVEQMSGSQHTSRNEGFDSSAADFRSNWQSAYGNQGGTFEQHEPAYRYGHELGGNPQYRGQNWDSVAPQIQREWNNKYPNTWDRVSNAVRYGFEKAMNSMGTGSRSTQETIR